MKPSHQPRAFDLRPATTIGELAANTALNVLSGPQLVVYLRLVAATGAQHRRTVTIKNLELHREPRTAVRALRELSEMGLIIVTYEGSMRRFGRQIEVVR